MTLVPTYPESTKTSLTQRLSTRARERWPELARISVRHRGSFSYVDGVLTDGTTLRLCRLRYTGSAHSWGFAIYRASHDDYDESFFPTGLPTGTCEDALDNRACSRDGPRRRSLSRARSSPENRRCRSPSRGHRT